MKCCFFTVYISLALLTVEIIMTDAVKSSIALAQCKTGNSGGDCARGGASGAQDAYGALAYNADTGRTGWSWNFESKDSAQKAALQTCGTGCKVVFWFQNGCGALAFARNGNYAWAWDESEKGAVKKALDKCEEVASGCQLNKSVCSK